MVLQLLLFSALLLAGNGLQKYCQDIAQKSEPDQDRQVLSEHKHAGLVVVEEGEGCAEEHV